MSGMESLEKVLALAVPQDPDLAMVLLMIRKIAAGEMDDSQLANLGYQAFGREFERPLTLIRAYLMPSAGRENETARFSLTIDVGGTPQKAPTAAPAASAAPPRHARPPAPSASPSPAAM